MFIMKVVAQNGPKDLFVIFTYHMQHILYKMIRPEIQTHKGYSI